jgi:hypothetical protein
MHVEIDGQTFNIPNTLPAAATRTPPVLGERCTVTGEPLWEARYRHAFAPGLAADRTTMIWSAAKAGAAFATAGAIYANSNHANSLFAPVYQNMGPPVMASEFHPAIEGFKV